jgi:hypothetical protein
MKRMHTYVATKMTTKYAPGSNQMVITFRPTDWSNEGEPGSVCIQMRPDDLRAFLKLAAHELPGAPQADPS